MTLDLDRIRALIEDESVDLPDITWEQAVAAVTITKIKPVPTTEPTPDERGRTDDND
jgi:hypothetical protein